jgi:hypothetical protein
MKPRRPVPEKRKKVKLVLPLFIAFILIMSVFGYVFGSFTADDSQEGDIIELGEYRFEQDPTGRWSVVVGGRTLELQFSPRELPSLDVDGFGLRSLEKIYLSVVPGENYLNALPDFYGAVKPVSAVFLACVEDGESCEDLPLKTCEDAVDGVGVVLLSLSEEQSVTVDGFCYTVEGDAAYINMVLDRFVLDYYEVKV